MALLLAGVAGPFFTASAANAAAAAAAAAQATSDPNQAIIVTAPPLFRDLRPERNLDETGIASYGVSTVDELVGELTTELGDDEEPLILVNGERINDLSEIGALPVEVLRSLQVLPRGSAVRVGGSPGQRVISLTLTRKARSATLTGAEKIATQGHWYATRGEAIGTYIRGATRANITLRVRDESSLLESQRNIIQPTPTLPFATGGNVIGFPDTTGEIDPLLSAAAGEPVTVVPLPPISAPTLADFVANANQAAVTDLGRFRTLRPKTRNYELNGTFGTRLAPWLTSTATFRLSRNLSRSLRGLPTGLFILSPDNSASPFSQDVGLAFFGQQPLHSRTRRDSADANLTLNAHFGHWTSDLNARHSESKDDTRTERQVRFGAIPLDDSIDPFGANLSDLITLRTDRATARTITNFAQLSSTGPAAKLPAGDVQATVQARLVENRLRSHSSFSVLNANQSFHRSEQSFRGTIDVPLTSRDNNFLAEVGNLNFDAEYGRSHYSDAGTLSHHAFELVWEPRPPFRLSGEIDETENPAAIQLLGNPVVVTPDVRVFDPLTGETVDVVQISGGNPSLRPEKVKTRRISGLVRLVPRLNLQLNGEYTDTDSRNFVSSLPEASAAVMLAFPDRFVRDANGVLTTIDLRPVNFDSHREKRVRYGLSLSAPLFGASQSSVHGHVGPQTRLQLTVNHTIVFSDRIVIRSGLDSVNLLEGGAIGIASGRVRHQIDGTAALTSGGLGVRVGVTWRGESSLQSQINGVTDTLRFSPLLTVNIRAFADASRLLGRSDWTHGMRFSLNVLNATNDRQSVRDSFGHTPLQFQAAYRDPIGRTIELELRKVF
jgi:iron complex outermembrane recepter protein